MPTVEQQLEEFRRRIDVLEGQGKKTAGALQLAPHQTGPRPGWFRAARIEGTQMILDFSASQAGVSPRISVTDTSGRTRAEMGNLAAYTGPDGIASPAMYGFRAMDATGNALFDSLGLIKVMTLVGGGYYPAAQSFNTGAFVDATAGGFNVTLSRAQAALVVWMVTGSIDVAGVGNLGQTQLAVYRSGTPIYTSSNGIPSIGTTQAMTITGVSWLANSTLTAGSYNFQIQCSNSVPAVTYSVTQVDTFIFGLGS